MADDFVLDAVVYSSPPAAGPKETQGPETPILFPTFEQLEDLFQIKFGKSKRDEDQFLADPRVQKAVRHIVTEDAYRGPYKLGDKQCFVCIDANHGDNECLQVFFGPTMDNPGERTATHANTRGI
jgi:hypothetical protein